MSCSCAEGQIDYRDGKAPVETGLNKHDCEYVAWRNSLIPIAERMASEVFSRQKEAGKWSVEFHRTMNRLAKQNGAEDSR